MKTNVTYGTIKNMTVDLPSQFSPFILINAFASAFVKYMTTNCLCSDEVLFSSIGESNCRKAMVAGIEERLEKGSITKEVADIFINAIKDGPLWVSAVLHARYGDEQGSRKYMEHMGYSPEVIEQLMKAKHEFQKKVA